MRSNNGLENDWKNPVALAEALYATVPNILYVHSDSGRVKK
ncbi:MAG: hypothetical protein WA364_11955 [Candidatus Nitrosopolaris sp.]